MTPTIRVVILVFSPVVTVVRALVRGILAQIGVRADPNSHVLALRNEIAGAIALRYSEGPSERKGATGCWARWT